MTDSYVPLRDTITQNDVPFCNMPEPGHLFFWWPVHKVELHIRHFDNQDGYAEVEVWFHDDDTGERQLALAPTNVQFGSIHQKAALLNMLAKWDIAVPWLYLVEFAASELRKRATSQNPTQLVVSDPTLSMEPEYLLWPLLYKGHPTIIFGGKGTAKSLFASVVAYILQLGLAGNKLGLKPPAGHVNVLYGDWEDIPETFRARWTAVQRGFKLQHPDIPEDLEVAILHKTMRTKLVHAVDTLRGELAENKVELFIVDSLGPAAGADLYAPQSALDFYEALRSLNVTSLILAHHAKDPATKTKSVFGSQFFTALARSVWQAESAETDDPDELIVSIKEVNCNLGPKHGVLGFRYVFDNKAHTITVTRCELDETELRNRLPTSLQVKAVLRSGPMTVKQLAEELEIAEATIGRTLRRLQDRHVVQKVGQLEGSALWALSAGEES